MALSFDYILKYIAACLSFVILFVFLAVGSFRKWYNKQQEVMVFFKQPREFHWFQGHLTGTTPWNMLTKRVQWATEFVTSYAMWNGWFIPEIHFCHPDSMKKVLKRSDGKNAFYKLFLDDWLGEGLLIVGGKRWLKRRRLLTPAFHFDILKNYVQIYNEATDVFIEKLLNRRNDVTGKTEFEASQECSLLTLDIMLRSAFSLESNCQLDSVQNCSEKTENAAQNYSQEILEIGQLVMKRMLNVFMWPHFIYRFTRDGRRYAKLKDGAHQIAHEVIARRRKELRENPSKCVQEVDAARENQYRKRKRLDFLDILLATKDENGEGLQDADIHNEVNTFMFAGHDTTATAISWFLYAIAKHPEHQKLCQEEVEEIFTSKQESEELSNKITLLQEDVAELKYLSLCLKECMRVYPPVPSIGRKLDEKLEVEGHNIPAAFNIALPIYAMHHNPHVWDNPEEFIPERFQDQGKDPYSYIPFSAGPRNCIGQNFALLEIKIVLAKLLHSFTFEVQENFEPQPGFTIVLKSRNGIQLLATANHIHKL